MKRSTIAFSTTPLAIAALALAGCGQGAERSPQGEPNAAQGAQGEPETGEGAQAPGDTADRRPYAGIGADETIHFTGTEPFWGGEVAGATLTYSTPENIDGTMIQVERFDGRGGLSFSGRYAGAPFGMAITPGKCSDGMSERTYPFVVTLEVEGEQRAGCAWTEARPYTAPPGYEP